MPSFEYARIANALSASSVSEEISAFVFADLEAAFSSSVIGTLPSSLSIYFNVFSNSRKEVPALFSASSVNACLPSSRAVASCSATGTP